HVKTDYHWKLLHRPLLVHLAQYTRDRSWLLPRSGQTIIRHGLPRTLLDSRKQRQNVPAPVAVFSSYAFRNLAKVIEAWRDVVHPTVPAARLIVTAEVERKDVVGLSPVDLQHLN